MYLYIYTHKPRSSATKICPLMQQRRQKAQRGDMSHSFSITELLPFTLREQEYGSGKVRKAGDKLCSMWHNSSQETANPTAHKHLHVSYPAGRRSSGTAGLCSPGWECWGCAPALSLHRGVRRRATCACCTGKAGARGLLDTPAAPLTQTGTETVWRQSWYQTLLWIWGSKC